MRLILILAIFAFIILFINSWLKMRQFKSPPNAEKKGRSETMLQCRYCGIHVPASTAVTDKEHAYCSKEHLELAHNKSDENDTHS
jgi:hypothetical protein